MVVLSQSLRLSKIPRRAREGRSFAAASGGNRRSGSPMRAKEAAQPVAAIAADEPSEARSISSELCERREATMLN